MFKPIQTHPSCFKMVDAGVLPSLTTMLKSKDEDKEETAAQVVWSLAFDPDAKKKIEAQPGCIEALQVRLIGGRNICDRSRV